MTSALGELYVTAAGNAAGISSAPLSACGHSVAYAPAASTSPSWGHHWYPGLAVAEENLGDPAISVLRRRGHDMQLQPAWQLGLICAAGQGGPAGTRRAAADPRGTHARVVGR